MLLSLALACVIWVCGCTKRPNTNIKNVIFISIDTCRADHLSCYGYKQKTTPNIDALAQQAILFENCISPIPITLPAHSSMLTGTIPPYHGVHDNLEYKLASSNVTLAEVLRKNGLYTAGIVSAFVLDSQFDIDQGFKYYQDEFEGVSEKDVHSERRGDKTSILANQWLDKNADKPFFLFLHYFDPHTKYDPPEPFKSDYTDNPYAGEVAFTDQCIGLVIQKLKDLDVYDSSLIIIAGDHGESLSQHGELTHSYYIYQSTIHVPFIIKLPNVTKPKRIDARVGLVDIAPTIYSLLGIAGPDVVHGRDLSVYFNDNEKPAEDNYYYSESLTPTKYGCNSLLSVTSDRWKYIQTTRPELYDLSKDPHETNDLATQQPQRCRILQDKLTTILETQVRKDDKDSDLALDSKTRARLESLGYVGGELDESFTFDQSKKDPKDVINFHLLNASVLSHIENEKYELAKKMCKQLLLMQPEHSNAYRFLAEIASKEGNVEEEVLFCSKYLELNPTDHKALNNLAVAQYKQNKFSEALESLNKALELKEDYQPTLYNMANVFKKLEKPQEAVKYYRKVLNIDPEHKEAHFNLGVVLQSQNMIDEAIQHYTETIRIDNDHAEAHNKLGIALQAKGSFDEATVHFKKSLDLKPENAPALYNMGWILIMNKQFDQAIPFLQRSLQIDPDNADTHNNLGNAFFYLGQPDKAIEHFTQAARLEPDNVDFQNALAAVYSKQGKQDMAIEHLSMSLKLKDDQPLVYKNLAELYLVKGELHNAVTHFTKLLEITPDSVATMNNLAWLLAVYNNEVFHDPKTALELAQKACELTEHGQYNLMDTMAVAYAANGNFSKAVETIKKAIELAKENYPNQEQNDLQQHLKLFLNSKPYRE